jgi:hypothetical protein
MRNRASQIHPTIVVLSLWLIVFLGLTCVVYLAGRWFHVEGEPLRLAASAHHLVHLGHRWILPAIYPQADYVESGGLMSYGPDRAEPLRRAAPERY